MNCEEPMMDAVDLAPARVRIRQVREQHVERIEYHPPGAHLVGDRPQARQHAAQVEIAGLQQFRGRLGLHEKELLRRQRLELPAEPLEVCEDSLRRLLEGDEHAGLAAAPDAVVQELHGENSFPGTGAARQHSGAAVRQSPAGDFIESGDARGRLGARRPAGAGRVHSLSPASGAGFRPAGNIR
jgi:hypothetical protein